MWWYNILGDNKGIILYLLWSDPIIARSVLLTVKLDGTKGGNYDKMLTVKITEWRKFIDSFGLSIEDVPSKVVKKKIYFVHIGYIPRPSSVKLHISRHHLDKYFNL